MHLMSWFPGSKCRNSRPGERVQRRSIHYMVISLTNTRETLKMAYVLLIKIRVLNSSIKRVKLLNHLCTWNANVNQIQESVSAFSESQEILHLHFNFMRTMIYGSVKAHPSEIIHSFQPEIKNS